MTSSLLAVGMLGPVLALTILVVGTGALAILSRRRDADDEVKTPPLGRAFLVGSLVGAALLAGGDALASVMIGSPILVCAMGGFAAGLVCSPLVLGSLLAGHATALALMVPFVANAGALAVTTAL